MTPSVAKMLGLILARYMRLRYRVLSGLARVTFSCFTAPHSTPSSLSSLPSSSAASISSSSTAGGTGGGDGALSGRQLRAEACGGPRPRADWANHQRPAGEGLRAEPVSQEADAGQMLPRPAGTTKTTKGRP